MQPDGWSWEEISEGEVGLESPGHIYLERQLLSMVGLWTPCEKFGEILWALSLEKSHTLINLCRQFQGVDGHS